MTRNSILIELLLTVFLLYVHTYVHTYLCIYMNVICMLHVTCVCTVTGGKLKHQERLVRKFNNLIIIHQTFHYQVQNNYLHKYTVYYLFGMKKFC